MKFKSPLLTQASGSVGGITATRSRSAQVLRARSAPVIHHAPGQVRTRSILASVNIAWENQSASGRRRWNDYAASTPMTNTFGDQIHLTGKQHFLRWLATRAIAAGTTQVTGFAPTIFNLGDTGQVQMSLGVASASEITIDILYDPAWIFTTNALILCFASIPTNPSRTHRPRLARFIGSFSSQDATVPGHFGFNSDQADPPIFFEIGQRIWTKVVIVQADKRTSSPIWNSAVATM